MLPSLSSGEPALIAMRFVRTPVSGRCGFQYYGFEVYERTHNDRKTGNLLYLDGHVEARAYQDMRSSDFGLTPDDPWTLTNSYSSVYTTLW